MTKNCKTFLQTVSIVALLTAGSQAALAQAIVKDGEGTGRGMITAPGAETPRDAETHSDRDERERLEAERARDTVERERLAAERIRRTPAATAATPRNKQKHDEEDSPARSIKGYMSAH